MILIAFHLTGKTTQTESMLIGMGMGAATAGPMMYGINRFKTKRREQKLLKELVGIINERKESEMSDSSSTLPDEKSS
ncbi:MAG: hypothetical protein ACK4TO_02590 [Candidatus Nitrosotenuis sp.]